MENPIAKFNEWWTLAKKDSPLQQQSAVCVSTVKHDGFPSGRFVDLKAANENGFTFCTFMDSNKGCEISHNAKVAITAWWDHVGLQVRVIGVAELISDDEANLHWRSRSRDAQLTTLSCKQSQELKNKQALEDQLQQARNTFAGIDIPRPPNWGGYSVKPISIEFLTFKPSRLHIRELFLLNAEGWVKTLLQP